LRVVSLFHWKPAFGAELFGVEPPKSKASAELEYVPVGVGVLRDELELAKKGKPFGDAWPERGMKDGRANWVGATSGVMDDGWKKQKRLI
jgi:hypothetical protein